MMTERMFPDVTSWTAIQGVCAWPNLQITPEGELLAFIFNQPCHGRWEGDLDCWVSLDQGNNWQFRSRPAPHEPGTARMNCAAGFDHNGDLIVLCSGISDRRPPGDPALPAKALHPWICRSSDRGTSWKIQDGFPHPSDQAITYIPFGNIRTTGDGMLAVACYTPSVEDNRCSFFLRSPDHGTSWLAPSLINPTGNETDILHLGGGQWLASSRDNATGRIDLFGSDDDGKTWIRRTPLTMPEQHTSHLIRLRDHRILFSYGNRNRNNSGIEVRTSKDQGSTWSPPVRLADTPRRDSGYPTSVQMDDQRMVTAYYTQLPGIHQYEMRVSAWNLKMLDCPIHGNQELLADRYDNGFDANKL